MDVRDTKAGDPQDGAEPVYGPAYTAGRSEPRAAQEPPPETIETPQARFSERYSPEELYDVPFSPVTAGALAYLLAPAVYFLLAPPWRSLPTVRFHSWQAVFYFLLVVAAREVEQVLASMLPSALGFLLGGLLLLAVFAGWLVAVVKALQGEQWQLPVVGRFAAQVARSSSMRN